MTYNARELSVQDGEPIELYEFAFASKVLRFTSSDVDQIFAGQTYAQASLSHPQIEESSSLPRNAVTITSDLKFPMVTLYRAAVPSDEVEVTIYEMHAGDNEREVSWIGRLLDIEEEENSAKLNCESEMTSFRRPGLTRVYSKNCPHMLYGEGCNVVRTNFKLDTTVLSVDGLKITSFDFGTYSAGRFKGGYIEWEPEPGRIEARAIREHNGELITLSHALPGLTAGAGIRAFPACKKTLEDCHDFFDNLANNGSTPFIPKVNPVGNSAF